MATTVTRYVNTSQVGTPGDGTTNGEGSGGTNAYASIAAWNSAEATDITLATGDDTTHVLWCDSGSGDAIDSLAGAVAFSGWTTGSGNEIDIKANTGAEATVPWAAPAYLAAVSSYSHVFNAGSTDYVHFTQITTRTARNYIGWYTKSFCTLTKCVALSQNAELTLDARGFFNYSTNTEHHNCVAYSENSNPFTGFWTRGPLYNCSSIVNDHTSSSGFKTSVANTGTVKNCVAFLEGSNGTCFLESGSGTFKSDSDYNASSDTTAPGGNSQTSISDPFRSLVTDDLRIESGSDLVGTGTDLSGDFTDDFLGVTRSSWDIGAFEYVENLHPRIRAWNFTSGNDGSPSCAITQVAGSNRVVLILLAMGAYTQLASAEDYGGETIAGGGMDELWADNVYEDANYTEVKGYLVREADLPANGTVTFTATVDENPWACLVVQIDDVEQTTSLNHDGGDRYSSTNPQQTITTTVANSLLIAMHAGYDVRDPTVVELPGYEFDVLYSIGTNLNGVASLRQEAGATGTETVGIKIATSHARDCFVIVALHPIVAAGGMSPSLRRTIHSRAVMRAANF